MEKIFEAFDSEEVGKVSPEMLLGIFSTMGAPPPPVEFLKSYIKSVEDEILHVQNRTLPTETSVRIEDKEGSHARTSTEAHERGGLVDGFEGHLEGVRTMWNAWLRNKDEFADNPCLGTAVEDSPQDMQSEGAPSLRYEYLSYSEVHERIMNIAAGLIKFVGTRPLERIGILLRTCPEWVMTEYALWSQRQCPVTLYHTFGKEAMAYIINHAELETVIVQESRAQDLLDDSENYPDLKRVIVVDESPDFELESLHNPRADSLTLYKFSQVEGEGAQIREKEGEIEEQETKETDKLFFIYTSGTTGPPKGVVHNQISMVANTSSFMKSVGLTSADSHFAFLPMAHVMEQIVEHMLLCVGGSIGFWRGELPKLMQDLATVKPTIVILVPRLLNRIQNSLLQKFSELEGAKKVFVDAALKSKKNTLAKGRYKSFYDLFAFQKAKEVLGGRVKFIGVGSAPIDPTTLELFRVVFGCTVFEGYGMSECLLASHSKHWDSRTVSNVGPPSSHLEIKLVDVPEMDYFTDADVSCGEVCMRGPSVMVEYYKDPERTAEAIDEDGWLHSGDIGKWCLPHGHLQIIDRKKSIFKLSQGEYVSPEKVENAIIQNKWIGQVFVEGNSNRPNVVGVVVPDPEVLQAEGVKDLSCEKFKEKVLADIEETSRLVGLKGFEIIKNVHFCETPFEELGLLTPTFKMKRNDARSHFKEIVEELYSQLE